MILKAALIFLITSSFGLAEKVSLTEAAEELSQKLTAGGIVTADGFTFSSAGKLIPADLPPEDLIFEIGSISKVFTGLLLTQAVIEKKVTLDTPISTLLHDLTFKDPRVGQITLRQLACHTSGLPRLPANLIEGADQLDPYAHYDRDRLHRALTSLELEANPPHNSSYSNLGVGQFQLLKSRRRPPWRPPLHSLRQILERTHSRKNHRASKNARHHRHPKCRAKKAPRPTPLR